ncbi:hypothetical protein [Bradyrhizobium erythrophlei]|uniref:Uncharacterized protein n=1 Tax=Bradyrhizobium erythrophlei TaxID=1437360 RepID=A0A1M5IG72_9BRAD|nr:hypothetical protein [Bradyrhizobium erythrophlei]SHG27302.1 hypothetical protein SAMN05443248_0966 [Bradyrhizobium erythrophlei]
MNEQQAEQTSVEPGSLNAGPAAPTLSDAQNEPVAASIQASAPIDAPDLVPEQDAAVEPAKADAAKADAPKVEAPKTAAPKADAPRTPGKLMIMSPDDRAWGNHDDAAPELEREPAQGMFGKRGLAALAAVVALAVVAGALGGVLATASLSHSVGDDTATSGNRALEASVARIDADVLALRASVEHTSKMGMAQFNKTSDRLDKLEKAQLEPAARLAKLSEAVDKLRAAPPAAPVPVAAAPAAPKEVTGSISPPAVAAPKVEVARLPTVEGWLLRDVANGGALIEGRLGIFEVYAGDPVPGLGRVDAIRRQDGRWVVVTSRGLIVAR